MGMNSKEEWNAQLDKNIVQGLQDKEDMRNGEPLYDLGRLLPEESTEEIITRIADPEYLAQLKKRLPTIRANGGSIGVRILRKMFQEYPNYRKAIGSFGDVPDYKLVDIARKYIVGIDNSLKRLNKYKNDMKGILISTLDAEGKNSGYTILKRLELAPEELISRYKNNDSMVMVKSRIINGIMTIGYYSEDICSLAFLEFEYMCANDISIRKCARCGRYFLPFSSLSRYCDRFVDSEKQKTCKDIAAMEKYSDKINNDTAKKLYRQRANTCKPVLPMIQEDLSYVMN